MALIPLMAVGLLELHPRSGTWFCPLLFVTVVLMLVAALRARYGRVESREWWFGFALFGSVYLCTGLATISIYDDHTKLPGHVLYMAALNGLANSDLKSESPGGTVYYWVLGPNSPHVFSSNAREVQFQYHRLHCAFSLVVAVAGGMITSRIAARNANRAGGRPLLG